MTSVGTNWRLSVCLHAYMQCMYVCQYIIYAYMYMKLCMYVCMSGYYICNADLWNVCMCVCVCVCVCVCLCMLHMQECY